MYRIYTEKKNMNRIRQILNQYLSGYTLLGAEGSWKGKPEKSVIIELADTPKRIVRRIAQAIKTANKQESVLVVHIPNEVEFL